MTTSIPAMTPKQAEAEVQSIRKAARRIMVSKEAAAKFLAAVRVVETESTKPLNRAKSRQR